MRSSKPRSPHIYAIGDLVSPLPLAHTAAKEAGIAVAHMAGEAPEPLNYSRVPRCIYTWPEAAAVGLTEAQAQAAGHTTRVDRYHFAASAKAMIENDTEGFWAVTSDSINGKNFGRAHRRPACDGTHSFGRDQFKSRLHGNRYCRNRFRPSHTFRKFS